MLASRLLSRTVSWRLSDSTSPAGSSILARRSAASTSRTVRFRAASARRSSHMRTAKGRSPAISTLATPATVASRSAMKRSM